MAQLVARLLLTPEIRGSNSDLNKILSTNCKIETTKIKNMRPGRAQAGARGCRGGWGETGTYLVFVYFLSKGLTNENLATASPRTRISSSNGEPSSAGGSTGPG